MKKVAFILGAGISVPAKIPSTSQITKYVLTGKNVMRHTDGNYYLDLPEVTKWPKRAYVPMVQGFLKILEDEIRDYYHYLPDRIVNYEDLYYVASQIFDSEMENLDNPVVGAFIREIGSGVAQLLSSGNEEFKDWKLHNLASEATNYVSDIVCRLLYSYDVDTSYLAPISEVINSGLVDSVNIFTSNHDTLIEQHLTSKQIDYIDGFGAAINGVRWWDSNLFIENESMVRLFKLHGSIDWYWMRIAPGDQGLGRVAIVLDGDHWHAQNPSGETIMSVEHRPLILAGTFNKMMEYSTGIFADLHYYFHHSLQEIDRLIVSGYSFGDKGINIKLTEWLYSSDENRLIVIHRKPENLRSGARGLISKNWNMWKKEGKLVVVPKWIEATSLQDIEDAL